MNKRSWAKFIILNYEFNKKKELQELRFRNKGIDNEIRN